MASRNGEQTKPLGGGIKKPVCSHHLKMVDPQKSSGLGVENHFLTPQLNFKLLARQAQ